MFWMELMPLLEVLQSSLKFLRQLWYLDCLSVFTCMWTYCAFTSVISLRGLDSLHDRQMQLLLF